MAKRSGVCDRGFEAASSTAATGAPDGDFPRLSSTTDTYLSEPEDPEAAHE
jgi:hypothetical protein